MSILNIKVQYRLIQLEQLNRTYDCRIPKQQWNYKPKRWREVWGTRRSVGVTRSKLSAWDKTIFVLILAENGDDEYGFKM